MVAEWVDAWAPTILTAHAEAEWAETLVLDSTDFWWTNARTGIRRREFAILVAYGYTRANIGRIWGIHATPTAQAHDWVRFLNSLNLSSPPASIVADDNLAIEADVPRMWPPAPGPSLPQPFLFACEHHLRERARNALEVDNAHAGRGLWMRRLDTAFRREEGWEEFHRATSVLGAAATWTANNDAKLRLQTSVRHLLPPHRSTAGAEAAAHRLRNLYEQRSFSLGNANRTNLLLGPTRLHLNNRDDVNAHHRILRQAAEAGQGRPRQGQRLNRDSRDANGDPQPPLR